MRRSDCRSKDIVSLLKNQTKPGGLVTLRFNNQNKMKNSFITLITILIPIYTFCQQTNFITDTITFDTITDVPGKNLAIDENNNIHICWFSTLGPYNRRIFYSKRDCGKGLWSEPEIVSDTNFFSTHPSIAVEKNTGIPHIVYTVYLDTSNVHSTEIIHAIRLSIPGWETENISKDTVASTSTNISLDKNNKCHIVWKSINSIQLGRVFYSNNIDGTWNTQILEDSSYYYGVGSDYPPSIAVTSNGIANIAFITRINEIYAYVRLARNEQPNGNLWEYEYIETPENNNFTVMISLYADTILCALISGNLSYYYGPNNTYYSHNEISGTWSPLEFINSTGGIKSMIIDNSGKIHALQSPGGGGVLGFGVTYYTTNLTGAWIDTLVPDLILQPYNTFNGQSIGITEYGKICFLGTITKNTDSPEISVIRRSDHCDTTNYFIDDPIDKEYHILVYPNPFSTSATIKFSNTNHEIHYFQLFSSRGEKVFSLNNIISDQITLNRNNLKSGLYFYRLMKESEIISTGKIVIR